ncbi:hypothetical protein HHE02_06280 [Helicobacter heilmannii]|uniref:Uncharacterized protein n=1 Tax=Helicobacter heilmannii TaxID=35817 RepID=A0A0K2XRI0_HELHE|nr:hypothetical protein BN341_5070 [Helicobacter heilmannii ASB1.4]CRF45722.1 hypothetical protein HHE014_06930 [Helicobacter heilmannii]CRF47340.1 hypothetical protein HHE02_06280 [Helicobacter heilmannii]CRF48697.1 hypothetical protein HHE03_02710 [Helicobacter heilmannii]CRF51595.1 hypothetical protein HHE06_14830 [Helicobacter heilmannii]
MIPLLALLATAFIQLKKPYGFILRHKGLFYLYGAPNIRF